MTENLPNALGQLASQNQFVMVGDYHSSLDITAAMANQKNFESLKAAGVKHLFLEFPPSLQSRFEAVASGKITEQQFVDHVSQVYPLAHLSLSEIDTKWRLFAQMSQHAHANGIAVHCVDNRDEVRDSYSSDFTTDPQKNDYFSLEDYIRQKSQITLPDGSLSNALDDDRPRAERIKKISRDEKGVVFYGMVHGRHSYDMDEVLGQDITARLEIFTGKINEAYTNFMTHAEHTDKDPAAARYYTGSDEVDLNGLKASLSPQSDSHVGHAPKITAPKPAP